MRLFGTDGIRGEVGKYPLTAENVLKLAKASSLVLSKKNSISASLITVIRLEANASVTKKTKIKKNNIFIWTTNLFSLAFRH